MKRGLSVCLSVLLAVSLCGYGNVSYAAYDSTYSSETTFDDEDLDDVGEVLSSGVNQEDALIPAEGEAAEPEATLPSDNNTTETSHANMQSEGLVISGATEAQNTIQTYSATTSSESSSEGAEEKGELTAENIIATQSGDNFSIKVVKESSSTEGASSYSAYLTGEVAWSDLESVLDNLDSTPSAVTFTGAPDASLSFDTTTSKLKVELEYAVTFDNIKLQTSGTKDAWLFAKGHTFKTTESVTTSGTFKIFGGGNETSVEGGTTVELYGGAFREVVGGSYYTHTNSDETDYKTVSVSGDTTVVIGRNASAVSVIGGCLGGINYGNIDVTYYASENDPNEVIIGSSADPTLEDNTSRGLEQSLAKVVNDGGHINVRVVGNNGAATKAGKLYGVACSNVDLGEEGSVTVSTDAGVTYQGCFGAYGCYTTTVVQNAGVYPSEKYATYEIGQILYYKSKANFTITMNGNSASGHSVQGCLGSDVIGDINMVVNGSAWGVYGGASGWGSVTGNINVSVGGTITEYVVGGGSLNANLYNLDYYRATKAGLETREPCADVTGNVAVTITGEVPMVYGAGYMLSYNKNAHIQLAGSVTVTIKDHAKVTGGTNYSVFGAGYCCAVSGDSTVTVKDNATVTGGSYSYGTIYAAGYYGDVAGDSSLVITDNATVGGSVFGGGYGGAVEGNTNVEINKNGKVAAYEKDLLQGVYGGGFYGNVTGDTSILLKDSAEVNYDVFGGGYCANVNNSTIVITDNASVKAAEDDEESIPGVVAAGLFSKSTNTGFATVYVKKNATIDGRIYGTYGSTVNGKTSVIFTENCKGSYLGVVYTDLVEVTDNADVTIDNTAIDPTVADEETGKYSTRDYAQFYDVADLTIDNGGKLILPSSAYITGNYTGDTTYTSGAETDNRGTLALTAGKLLDVQGSVSGWTRLSILDATATSTDDAGNETTTTVTDPREAQVYVVSEAGSAPSDANAGKFTWVDQRNYVLLDWNETCTLINNESDEGVPVAAEEASEEEPAAGEGSGEGTELATSPSEWWLVPLELNVVVSPVSITAYEGGTSINGNHIPQLRYAVQSTVKNVSEEVETYNESRDGSGFQGLSVNDLSFTLYTKDTDTGEYKTEHLNRSRIDKNDAETYCLFPQLDADLGELSSEGKLDQLGTYLKLVDVTYNNTSYAGVYAIEENATYGENADWYLTASFASAERSASPEYPVTFKVKDENNEPLATVIVRKVADEASMYNTPSSYLSQVVSSEEALKEKVNALKQEANASDSEQSTSSSSANTRKAFALVPEGTVFLTNDTAKLGLVGAGENGYELNNAVVEDELVALLFDEMTTLTLDKENLQSKMMELAEQDANIESDEWEKEYRYLDLVNANDGNVVVTAKTSDEAASQAVTIYWPYPDGVTKESASSYTFKILHYVGMNRETSIDENASLKDAEVSVESIEVEPTEYGLKFTTSSFSPFVLLWQTKKVTLTRVYDQVYHQIGIGTPDEVTTYEAGTEINMNDIDSGYTWYADEDYKNLISESFVINEDTTVYAGSAISGDVDNNVTLTLVYDLNYHKNGMGLIPDEVYSYTKGTTVDVAKLKGDTYEWYEDEACTQKITEPFTMNANKVIYAKEKAASSDTPLSTTNKYTLTLVYDQNWAADKTGTADKTYDLDEGTYVDMALVDNSYEWYLDKDFTTPVSNPFIMDANKTIYAKAIVDDSSEPSDQSSNTTKTNDKTTTNTSSKTSKSSSSGTGNKATSKKHLTTIGHTSLSKTDDSVNLELPIAMLVGSLVAMVLALTCVRRRKRG
jgi:hypothetical protein